jgi:hypothetical protein
MSRIGGLVAGVVIVVAVLVSGCETSRTLPSSLPSFCPLAPLNAAPQPGSDLEGNTEPRTGPGPYKVAVFADEGGLGDLEDELKAKKPSWTPENRKVQVVVCQYQTPSDERLTMPCDGYRSDTGQPVSVAVNVARYDYKVYDASTKELLGQFDLRGTSRDCPDRAVAVEGAQPSVVARPDYDEVIGDLLPYAEPNR